MHTITFSGSSKAEQYQSLLPQLAALIEDENNLIANLANVAAVLKSAFDWLWVGFYLVDNQELVLGPFQGPLACTRIPYGRGVCGQAWKENHTMLVYDVNQHPDHIACSSLSQSEIVVPLRRADGTVFAVLDVDDVTVGTFDAVDQEWLEQIAALIGKRHHGEYPC